jgi:GNAT superfamily N-acetyltransferase
MAATTRCCVCLSAPTYAAGAASTHNARGSAKLQTWRRFNLLRARPAALADIARIIPMVQRYWNLEAIDGFDPRSIESTLAALLSHAKHGACWVADNDGILCGYLTAVYMLSVEHGGLVAEIDEFFVEAAHRSLGAGSLLIAAAESDMGALGVKRMQLQLKRGNQRGLAFYERQGFKRRADYELLDKPLWQAK